MSIERPKVRICSACGKRDGERGWDASCHMHAVWVWVDSITEGPDGRVAIALAVPSNESSNEEGEVVDPAGPSPSD